MKIVPYPHPALRTPASLVTAIDRDLTITAEKMLELMYEKSGLGLAAPQVALPYQLLVMNFAADPKKKDHECVAINPVIVESAGTEEDREGCLSFPELFQKVRRAQKVRVRYYNLKGELLEMVARDLAARVWQHEIDHLHGKLFIDRMGGLARKNSLPDLKRFEKDFQEALARGDYPPGTTPIL